MREPQSCLGPKFATSVYKFFLTRTSTPANVYQDGALTTPFSPTGVVTADAFGRFPAIYLDTSVIYKVQLFNSLSVLQWTTDPYTPPLATVGTSSLSAYGMNIAPTGEVTIPTPNSGGTGISLTLKAGALGSAPLQISAPLPGNSALIINSAVTTAAMTAIFQANNKPGTPPTTYNVALTMAPSGATYTGGTLTANFTGPTASNYTVQLSTGQDIFGCTLTNMSTTFTCPSTVISGSPTVNIGVMTPVTPAGWLPITCDGVQYYIPIWHSNNFSPYVANPSALGENISAQSVTFGGTGLTTVTGGTASPANWFSPATPNIGASYWINITKSGGLSGLSFNVASNVSATVAPSGATYTGGTLTANFNGNTASNYTLLLSTGQAITGCTFTNASTTFTCPSTNISGTPNVVLQVSVQGVWESITSGGLTINSNAQAPVTATYQLSSNSSGTTIVANGVISLSGNNGVQQPTWNGITPFNLAGDGTATFNSVATSSWYAPSTGSIGADYYIKITPTGGATGYSFSAATGSYTNITSGGLTISLSGSGGTGVPYVTGTYVIASDSGGVNQLGSGTIRISNTLTRTYTTGTNVTETVPTGATTVVIEAWGAGAGGAYNFAIGGGGGGGAYVKKTLTVSGGQTFTYTVGALGLHNTNNLDQPSGNGGNGTASTVSTGTGPSVNVSAGGGVGGAAGTYPSPGAGGAGGTASGGDTNTNGGAGALGNPAGDSPGGSCPNGGAGGAPGGGVAPGGGGSGGYAVGSPGSGANGQIRFTYS